MNIVSALLRLICGGVLLGAAYVTYERTRAHVADGQPLQLFGITFSASPGQVQAAVVVIGVIGVLLIILGLLTFTRKRT